MGAKIRNSMALRRLQKVQLPQHDSLGRTKRNLDILIESLENDSIGDEEAFNDLASVVGTFKDARKTHDLYTDDVNDVMDELVAIVEALR